MRKMFFGLLAALAVSFTIASPANAGHKHRYVSKPAVVGVVAGTVFGVGLHEGWWGTTFGVEHASVGGSIAGGFIVGVATVAMIHAATTPCTGFHALFGGKGCKNGKYVGKYRHAHLFW
jgi:hypothetical protein